MIIVMKNGSSQENVDRIVDVLKAHGLGANLSTGAQATIIGVLGDKSKLADVNLELLRPLELLFYAVEHISRAHPPMHSRGWKMKALNFCAGPLTQPVSRSSVK